MTNKKNSSTTNNSHADNRKDKSSSRLWLAEQSFFNAQNNLSQAINHEKEIHHELNRSSRLGTAIFTIEKILASERITIRNELKQYKGDAEVVTMELMRILDNFKMNQSTSRGLLHCIDTMQKLVNRLDETLTSTKNPYTKLRTEKLLNCIQPVMVDVLRYRSQLLESNFDGKRHEEKKKAYHAAKHAKRKAAEELEKADAVYQTLTSSPKKP